MKSSGSSNFDRKDMDTVNYNKVLDIGDYSDERLCFLLDTFHQGLLSVGLLVGMNCLVFWKELIMKDSVLISPSQHLLWVKTGIWCGWW